MNYTVKVWYAATPEELDAAQLREAIGQAVADLEGAVQGVIPKQALDRLRRLCAEGNAWEPQVHTGLHEDSTQTAAEAFLRDLLGLEGRGVRRLLVEAE